MLFKLTALFKFILPIHFNYLLFLHTHCAINYTSPCLLYNMIYFYHKAVLIVSRFHQAA